MPRRPGTPLSLDAARRAALAAQGFTDPRPTGRIDIRHLRRVLRRVHVLQIDAVNVLVRAHYLPLFARLGPYPMGLLDDAAYRRRELFEYWAHEASLIPISAYPLHRWRMRRIERHGHWPRMTRFARENASFIRAVEDELSERGPLTASELSDGGARKGPWWGWADGKTALEWLFAIGRVAVRERRGFARVYDLTERVIPMDVLDLPPPSADEAVAELTRGAVNALGVALPIDISEYYRVKVARVQAALNDLETAGEVVPVDVEGWRRPAYAPANLVVPRRVEARALVSPFDSLVWDRQRTERLFGFRYRIEIYVPKKKRRYGYYVLPFLLDDRLVARVDLKADRQGRRLLVRGAYREPGADSDELASALGAELASMATWLELDEVVVRRRGDLATALASALSGQ